MVRVQFALTLEMYRLKQIDERAFVLAKLPKWILDLISIEIENQQNSLPPGGRLIDPTGLDTLDQNSSARPSPPPRPMPSGRPG